MKRVDALVLGGGPAGAGLALLLARQGVRVLLLERERFPRDKVCGEFVSAEGCAVIRRLGLLEQLRRLGAQRMHDCRISSLAGQVLDAPLPQLPAGREALGLTRARLDALLLDEARGAGVEVRDRWEYLSPRLHDGRVQGVLARQVGRDRQVELEASVVIAADGRRSRLARALHDVPGDPVRSGPDAWFGHKVHLRAGSTHRAARVELHLFPGGYAGLAPVEDGRINLCLMARVASLRKVGSLDRLLEQAVRANPAARAALDGARPCSRWHSVGPLRFATRRAAAAGALFVGDAAGTIDPFTGDGISHALLAAELAAPFVLAAVDQGGLSSASGREYARLWSRAFAPVTRRSRWLGRLFERPHLAGPALSLLRRLDGSVASRLVSTTRTGLTAPAGIANPKSNLP